jgi:type IV pilus assembly protein PilB
MVGEIRDTETAQIAINSALTGHLVFTTVHANNVVDVLGASSTWGSSRTTSFRRLNCILAQRLVRLICEFCKKEVHYSVEELEASGLDPKEWSNVRRSMKARVASNAPARVSAAELRSTNCWI